MKLWKPGAVIVWREVLRGKVYSAVPMRVVRDAPELLALYLAPRTRFKFPCTHDGRDIRLREDDWILGEMAWTTGDLLFLTQLEARYTATAFWDERHGFDHWKINLEETKRRTAVGFDYLDELLDIIVSADRATWRWKDEDELLEAQRRGFFTPAQAREIRAAGERALELMRSNKPPFDGGWENWSPDPAWRTIPALPAGWDIIE